jgi:ABC-type Fe3+-hydroxamate transport system, periplasmic component
MKRFSLIYLPFIILVSLNVSNSEKFPQRIVSLSPSTTEIIYGLGAWENVVGVTIYSDFPPEAKNLPKVGGWINPNFESILSLNPDLVVMMLPQDRIFGNKIRKLGLKTLSVDSNDSIEDIMNSIQKMGKALGRDEETGKLIKNLRSDIEDIKTKTKNITPKRVLFVFGRNPGTLEDIYVVGKTSFINEAITLAGGENIVESDKLAIRISREAILSLNPEVIIEINHENVNKDEALKIWNQLSEVSAVRDKEVYILTDTVFIHPSQRVIEGAKILTNILHPEIFRDIELSVVSCQ